MNNIPPYDYEKEYQYTRNMANEINHRSINILISLSTGAIVFSPNLVKILDKSFENFKIVFMLGNTFLLFSVISGVIQLMVLHFFWEKLAIYHEKLLKGEDIEKPKTHSSSFFQYVQFITFILGIISFCLIFIL